MLLLSALTVQGLAADDSSKSNKAAVFSYLKDTLGFNTAATCGIMANIESESGFDPTLVIRDRNGRLSGGLCQWNGLRFSNLIQFCNEAGLSYLSIPGQLSFLKHELKKQDFKHIYKHLIAVPDTAEGAYDAGYYWCYYFEIPSNRAARANSRGSEAANRYWPVYERAKVAAVRVKSEQDGQTLDLSDSLNLRWNKAKNAKRYVIQTAKKTAKGYDWKNAIEKTVSGKKTALTLPLKSFSIGKYAVRVLGKNVTYGTSSEPASTVTFSVACKPHDYVLTSSKEPTFKNAGEDVYTCKKCGETKTVTKDKLTVESFEAQTIGQLKAKDCTPTSVTLTWPRLTGASGYRVYQKLNGKWSRVKTLNGAGNTRCTVEGLASGNRCEFSVCAFVKRQSKIHFTKEVLVAAYTLPQAPKQAKLRADGTALCASWSAVPNASGYTVFLRTNADDNYRAVANVAADAGSYRIKNCKAGKAYDVIVKAYLLTRGGKQIFSAPSNARMLSL